MKSIKFALAVVATVIIAMVGASLAITSLGALVYIMLARNGDIKVIMICLGISVVSLFLSILTLPVLKKLDEVSW